MVSLPSLLSLISSVLLCKVSLEAPHLLCPGATCRAGPWSGLALVICETCSPAGVLCCWTWASMFFSPLCLRSLRYTPLIPSYPEMTLESLLCFLTVNHRVFTLHALQFVRRSFPQDTGGKNSPPSECNSVLPVIFRRVLIKGPW